MKITITPTTPSDIVELAQVRKETWLATYPNKEFGITTEDLLSEDFDSEERIKGWQEVLQKPHVHNIVAKVNNKVIAFAIAVKQEKENAIKGLYVLPEYQHNGIGRQLMEDLLNWLGNDKDIVLNVASYNDNAIKFYERYGFVKGERVVATENDLLSNGKEIPEIKMIKKFSI